MSLKNFFLASLIIHIIGAIALYFYYNPIHFAPQPVGQFEEENLAPETKEEVKKSEPRLKESKKKKIKKAKTKPKKVFKKTAVKKISKGKSKKTKPSSKPKPTVLDSTPKQALSEAKDPAPEIKTTPIETRPPNDIELEEIEEEEPVQITKEDPSENQVEEPVQIAKDPSENQVEEVKKTTEGIPEDIDQMEEIEEEETENSSDSLKITEANPNSVLTNTDSGKTKFKTFQSLKQKRGNIALTYPDFARRKGMEGTVSVVFFVSEQGLVDQIQLSSSSGHAELDNYVLRELARYEFLPGQESWVQYKIPFKLEGVEKEYERLRNKEDL